MGYISIQFNKAKGSADTGASDHIERKTIPKNADPTRTCLNRELVDVPDGVTNRTEAHQEEDNARPSEGNPHRAFGHT